MNLDKSPASFGRVDSDGTVYVRTEDGERSVGQVPDVTAEEALSFFTRRYESLQVEVANLEGRVRGGTAAPDEARKSLTKIRESLENANAVGNLAALAERLNAIAPLIDEAAQARKQARLEAAQHALVAKEALVVEAETLAQGSDWRHGVDRFRALLTEWKALARVDRGTDDELWRRFSSARTTYTRRRKAQFTQLAQQRDAAKLAKEEIIEDARELSRSTDWGYGARAFRDLMTRWKEAGSAARSVDDQLWKQFRGLQETFFNAKAAAQSEVNEEQGANLNAKEALLAQVEAQIVTPIEDLEGAKATFRTFLSAFNEIGHVPRQAIRALDGRVKALDAVIKSAEAAEWKRTDPDARKRAEDTIEMFTLHIAKLEEKLAKAEAAGDKRSIKDATDSIATYTSWLNQAKETLDDFTR